MSSLPSKNNTLAQINTIDAAVKALFQKLEETNKPIAKTLKS